MRRSLKYESYHNDFKNQCIYLLKMWIIEYLDRHNLKYIEIDYNEKTVYCYHNDCNNMFEDYFDFNYTEVDLFNLKNIYIIAILKKR